MAEDSNIGWTDNTQNFWIGCDKVSPGCTNCYMFSGQKRFGNDPTVLKRTKDATFNKPLIWHKRMQPEDKLLVFVCSWSDFFHKDADDWRADAWDIIRQTPNITYQILTKRPGLVASRLPEDWGEGYDNVWLGTSAENQEWFDRRWSVLAHIPAKVRFISYEPALGPVSIHEFLGKPGNDHYDVPDWIICGAESGPGARLFNSTWARTIVNEGKSLGFQTFVKQLGKYPVISEDMEWPAGTEILEGKAKLKEKKGSNIEEWPNSLRVQEWPEH